MDKLIVKGNTSISDVISQLILNFHVIFNRPDVASLNHAQAELAGDSKHLFNLCMYLYFRARYPNNAPDLLIKNDVVIVEQNGLYYTAFNSGGRDTPDKHTSSMSFREYYLKTIAVDDIKGRQGIAMYERALGMPMNNYHGIPISGTSGRAHTEERREHIAHNVNGAPQTYAARLKQARSRVGGGLRSKYTPVNVKGRIYSNARLAGEGEGLGRTAVYARLADEFNSDWLWDDGIHNPVNRRRLVELVEANNL